MAGTAREGERSACTVKFVNFCGKMLFFLSVEEYIKAIGIDGSDVGRRVKAPNAIR